MLDNSILDPWVPTAPKITCGSLCRSPDHYLQVVSQFDVTKAKRFQPVGSVTYCNIFLWDVTRAMSCEIPHWVAGKELNANAVCDWLTKHGQDYGWLRCDNASAATMRANSGFPTVAVWKNPSPSKSGHVACIIPGVGVQIAQAGKKCYFGVQIDKGFGKLVPTFYTHD